MTQPPAKRAKRKPKRKASKLARKPFFVGQRFKAFGRMWTVFAVGRCDANDIRITVERTR